MFSKVHALPPLIHHEDGSDEASRQRRGMRSKWYRRVGLGKAAGLVVPTETMEHAALIEWQQPLGRVKTIRDGVDLKRFTRVPKTDAIPRLLKRPGEFWVGCFAQPGGDSATLALVEAMERLAPEWHLVVVGAPSEGGSVGAAATQRGLDHRVHFAPANTSHASALALFDIVAATGETDPLPLTVIEAMAASRPVVAFEGVDAVQALSTDNADLLASEPPAAALMRLAGDRYLRETIGAANRERAAAERDEAAMIAAYRRLYSSAVGRDTI
jgi:glycosyltransferase involved in cell wall biosynthesis